MLLDDGLSWGPAIDGDLITRPTMASLARRRRRRQAARAGRDGRRVHDGRGRAQAKTLRFDPAGLALAKLGRQRARSARRTSPPTASSGAKGTAAVLGRYITDRMFRPLSCAIAAGARRRADLGVPLRVGRRPSMDAGRCTASTCRSGSTASTPSGVTAIAGEPAAGARRRVHGAASALVRDGDPGWPSWSADARHDARVRRRRIGAPDVDADGYAAVARAALTLQSLRPRRPAARPSSIRADEPPVASEHASACPGVDCGVGLRGGSGERADDLALEELDAGAVVRRLGEVVDGVAEPVLARARRAARRPARPCRSRRR